MALNPFVELARDPVWTLTAAGYLVLMLGIAALATGYAVRMGAALVARADRSHRQRDWWGESMDGWLPPAAWTVDAGKVAVALVLGLWAGAALARAGGF